MLQTIEALIDDRGHVKWLDNVHLSSGTHRVLITILDTPSENQIATQEGDLDIPTLPVGAWLTEKSFSRKDLYNDGGR